MKGLVSTADRALCVSLGEVRSRMSKVVLQAVMSKDEAATIRAIAKAKGMPVSTWLRMIALAVASDA